MTHDKPAAREWPKDILDLALPYAMGQHSGPYNAIRDVEILARAIVGMGDHDRIGFDEKNDGLDVDEFLSVVEHAAKDRSSLGEYHSASVGALRSGGDGPRPPGEMKTVLEKAQQCVYEYEVACQHWNRGDYKYLFAKYIVDSKAPPHPDSCPPRESETLRTDSCPPRESGTGVGMDSLPSVGPSSEPSQQGMVEEIAKVVYAADPTINYKTGTVAWDAYPAAKGQPMPGRRRIAYKIADALISAFPALSRPAVTEEQIARVLYDREHPISDEAWAKMPAEDVPQYGDWVTGRGGFLRDAKAILALLHGGK